MGLRLVPITAFLLVSACYGSHGHGGGGGHADGGGPGVGSDGGPGGGPDGGRVDGSGGSRGEDSGSGTVDAMVFCTHAPPSPCVIPGSAPGCCMRVPARCEAGEWVCMEPAMLGVACETFTCPEDPGCPDPPPVCWRAVRDGACCISRIDALCTPDLYWQCPDGAVEESTCGAFGRECPGT